MSTESKNDANVASIRKEIGQLSEAIKAFATRPTTSTNTGEQINPALLKELTQKIAADIEARHKMTNAVLLDALKKLDKEVSSLRSQQPKTVATEEAKGTANINASATTSATEPAPANNFALRKAQETIKALTAEMQQLRDINAELLNKSASSNSAISTNSTASSNPASEAKLVDNNVVSHPNFRAVQEAKREAADAKRAAEAAKSALDAVKLQLQQEQAKTSDLAGQLAGLKAAPSTTSLPNTGKQDANNNPQFKQLKEDNAELRNLLNTELSNLRQLVTALIQPSQSVRASVSEMLENALAGVKVTSAAEIAKEEKLSDSLIKLFESSQSNAPSNPGESKERDNRGGVIGRHTAVALQANSSSQGFSRPNS